MSDTKKGFKKIIHPSTGFEIYIKPLKGTNISEISTSSAFEKFEQESLNTNSIQIQKIQNEIKSLKKEYKENNKYLSHQLTKQNKFLKYCITALSITVFLSLFL